MRGSYGANVKSIPSLLREIARGQFTAEQRGPLRTYCTFSSRQTGRALSVDVVEKCRSCSAMTGALWSIATELTAISSRPQTSWSEALVFHLWKLPSALFGRKVSFVVVRQSTSQLIILARVLLIGWRPCTYGPLLGYATRFHCQAWLVINGPFTPITVTCRARMGFVYGVFNTVCRIYMFSLWLLSSNILIEIRDFGNSSADINCQANMEYIDQ